MLLTICHNLRYTPWVRKLKELIDTGAIGDVVNIQHLEPVSLKSIFLPWVGKLKELIDNEPIGDLVNIQHFEPVSLISGKFDIYLM